MCRMSALVLAIAFVLTGCAEPSVVSDEMRQQEVDMGFEVAAWKQEAAAWDTDVDRMREELAQIESTRAIGHERAVSDINARLEDLERDVTRFQVTLERHGAEVDAEAERPEPERIRLHTALWRKHMATRSAQEKLALDHHALMTEQAEVLAKFGAGRRPTGG